MHVPTCLPTCLPACLPATLLPGSGPQDEAGELRRRLAVVTHQVDALRGEVAAREGGLAKEKQGRAKVRVS